MKEKNKNNLLLIILLLVIIFVVLAYYYLNTMNKENKNINLEKKEEKSNEINGSQVKQIEYGILSVNEINPFKNIDFNKRIISKKEDEFSYINFDSNGIKYYVDDLEKEMVNFDIKNVKQAGLTCRCGGCDGIYYLTEDKKLYNIKFSHQEDIKELDYKKSTTLISDSVEAFDFIDLGVITPTTCGGNYVVFKSTNGKTYIDYDSIYEIDLLKRIVVESSSFNEEDALYLVSDKIKVNKYIKTEENKNILSKRIFIFSGTHEDGDGDAFFYLYVLNEDDYLYYSENYKKYNMKKYHDSKVKEIKITDNDIVVTFEDGKKEIIDAYEFKID